MQKHASGLRHKDDLAYITRPRTQTCISQINYILSYPNMLLIIKEINLNYMEDNQSYRTTVKLKEKKGKCKNDTSNKEIYGARF